MLQRTILSLWHLCLVYWFRAHLSCSLNFNYISRMCSTCKENVFNLQFSILQVCVYIHLSALVEYRKRKSNVMYIWYIHTDIYLIVTYICISQSLFPFSVASKNYHYHYQWYQIIKPVSPISGKKLFRAFKWYICWYLAGLVGRAYDFWSPACEFKPHVRCRLH